MGHNDGNKISPAMKVILPASVVLSFYFMITYSGPFRWLAELQLRLMSAYSEKITFVATCLLLMGAGAVLVWPYRRRAAPAPTNSVDPATGDPAEPPPPAVPKGPGLWERLGSAGQFGAVFVFVGAIVVWMALSDMRRLSGNADLTDLAVKTLEAGEAPPSHWVNLAAVPLVDATVTFKSSKSRDEDSYVPLLSEDHDPSAGIFAFAKYDGRDESPPSQLKPAVIQGLISAGGLPGPVRAEYERVSLLHDGQTYYLVEVGKDPVTQRGRALSTLRIGTAIIAGGALLAFAGFVWTRRRLSRGAGVA